MPKSSVSPASTVPPTSISAGQKPAKPKSAKLKSTKLKAIKPAIASATSYEELEALELEGSAGREQPPTLLLAEIEVADQVFQWRQPDYNEMASKAHVKELMGVLAQGEALDPILVMSLGPTRVFVVDGHHRLRAYASQGWTKPIPVEWWPKSLALGKAEALKRNVKSKLPMTADDKMESAWTLAKALDPSGDFTHSKKTIRKETGVSEAQVAIMRKRVREFPEWTFGTWRDARRMKVEAQDYDRDQWRDAKVAELKKVIEARLAKDIAERTDLFCDALESLFLWLPQAMAAHWISVTIDVAEQHFVDEEAESELLDI